MFMKSTLTIVLAALFGINIYATEIYIPGYVLLNNGDTIRGYLLTQNSLNAAKFCVFKKSTENLPVKYSPNEINGYRYSDDKYYVSKEINADSNKKRTVFMEFLINGISDIYYYKDNSGDHYYIEKDKTGLLDLTEKQQIYEGKIIPAKYKGKLRWIMADCSVIASEIEKTSLSHKSLINLGKSYHEKVCPSESCLIYERNNLSGKFKFGFILGLSMNRYNFGNLLISSYEPGFQIGIGMKLGNIFYSDERFHLGIKVLFEKDHKYLMTPNPDFTNNYSLSYNGVDYILSSINAFNSKPDLTVNLDVLDLKIPIMINYKFPVKNSSLNLGMGITDKIIISKNSSYIDYEFQKQYGKSINTLLVGGIASIGFDRYLSNDQEIGINLNYEYLVVPRAVNTFLRLRESQVSLQLNYYFK